MMSNLNLPMIKMKQSTLRKTSLNLPKRKRQQSTLKKGHLSLPMRKKPKLLKTKLNLPR